MTKKTQYSTQLSAVEKALRTNDTVPYAGDFLTNPSEPATTLGQTMKVFTDTQEELSTTKTSLETTKTELTATTAEAQDLKTKLTSTERDLEEAKTNMATFQEEMVPIKEELQALNDLLGGRPLDELLADYNKIKDDFQMTEAEKKVIEDILQDKTAKLQQLEGIVSMGERGVAPLDLSGKILAINKAWNFVVLDVGRDDNLPEGVDLTVYRGDDLVGKVRTVAVDTDTTIADVLPDWTKSQIQIGDQVLF
ncbi:MAG: hypothetical protein AAFY98_04760 [Verrucomicrobiota bacterium]